MRSCDCKLAGSQAAGSGATRCSARTPQQPPSEVQTARFANHLKRGQIYPKYALVAADMFG
jgi:hypothetical protein